MARREGRIGRGVEDEVGERAMDGGCGIKER